MKRRRLVALGTKEDGTMMHFQMEQMSDLALALERQVEMQAEAAKRAFMSIRDRSWRNRQAAAIDALKGSGKLSMLSKCIFNCVDAWTKFAPR